MLVQRARGHLSGLLQLEAAASGATWVQQLAYSLLLEVLRDLLSFRLPA